MRSGLEKRGPDRCARPGWRCCLVAALLLHSFAATAEPAHPEDPLRDDSFADHAHARFSRFVGQTADRIDRFFNDERIDESFNETRLRLAAGVEIVDAEGLGFVRRLRADLRLPRTQRRLNLVLSTVTGDELGVEEEQNSFVGFLRFFVLDRDVVRVNLDGGLNFSPQPDPFLKLRGEREFVLGSYLLRPAQILFWELEDGVGEATRLDLDRRLSPQSLARFRSEIIWSEDNSGVQLESFLFYFHKFSKTAGLALKAGVFADSEFRNENAEIVPGRSSAVMTAYLLGLDYRFAIFRDWLLLEIEPELRFPRERAYEFTPGITFRLEVVLGEDRMARGARMIGG